MTALQAGDDCHTNDLNNLFPIALDSLRFPLDRSMRVVFTGYFNGFSVEVRSIDEMNLLYHMGCYGKGTASRSKPKVLESDGSPCIIRKRQYLMRNLWHKKFKPQESAEKDTLLKEIDELVTCLKNDCQRNSNKDVIDLVSSDDESGNSDISDHSENIDLHSFGKQNIVVIVPNSDSEGDDYFANLKPLSCINKIQLEEKLLLTLQESFFLLYALGCLQVINTDNKILDIEQCWKLFVENDNNFVSKYVIYHYYKSKGYIVKSGLKFGGDYLLYKKGPGLGHADYIVVIRSNHEKFNYSYKWISILGHVRMANTAVKQILLAEVIAPAEKVTLPSGLNKYSVRELLLNKNIPAILNNEVD